MGPHNPQSVYENWPTVKQILTSPKFSAETQTLHVADMLTATPVTEEMRNWLSEVVTTSTWPCGDPGWCGPRSQQEVETANFQCCYFRSPQAIACEVDDGRVAFGHGCSEGMHLAGGWNVMLVMRDFGPLHGDTPVRRSITAARSVA